MVIITETIDPALLMKMLGLGKSVESVDNAPENFNQDGRSLISFLCDSLAVLWKDWPKHMDLTELEAESGKFSLRGTCPHCQQGTVFIQVTTVHAEELGQWAQRLAVGMQCQGCLEHILATALKTRSLNEPSKLGYLHHYPVGKPQDVVDSSVPQDIAEDFAEAMRCFWVKSYKASVAMCRRSVEASCKQLGAKGKNLNAKIDDLFTQGKITEPLKRMAHRVRLTANEKLHGDDNDDLNSFEEKDAQAMIACVEQFFHHVYVMPALLDSYDEK